MLLHGPPGVGKVRESPYKVDYCPKLIHSIDLDSRVHRKQVSESADTYHVRQLRLGRTDR